MSVKPLLFSRGDEEIALSIESISDGWRITLPNGISRQITSRRLADGTLVIADENRSYLLPTAATERGIEIALAGQTYIFKPVSGRRMGSRRSERAPGALTAPMAGIVADVLVEPGQAVEAYQPLAAIEAMKVYATIEAPMAGIVTAVHIRKGERVTQGAPVVEIAPQHREETPAP